MFVKHETTRRLLGRAGFLWLCALPTFLIVAWSVFVWTPPYRAWQHAAWKHRIEQMLGVSVLIDKVSQPKYNVVLLEGVSLVDPETQATIAQIRTVEATHNDRGWVLLASHAEMPAARTGTVCEMLQDRGLRGLRPQSSSLEAKFHELTIHDAKAATTFHDVLFTLEPIEVGTRAKLEFRIAGLTMARPAELVAIRHRKAEFATTQWDFDTHETPLPCAMFSDVWPDITKLGRECRFNGFVSYTQTPTGGDATINGSLSQVDLDLLLSGFSHKVSGVADIALNKVTLQKGKLVAAAGAMKAKDGTVSRHLLESLSRDDTTHMQIGRPLYERFLWPYQQLSFGFKINAQGLDIKGLCTQTEQGVVMTDRSGILLKESDMPFVPVVALVRALVRESEILIPASPETRALLDWLPFPPIKPRLDERGNPYPPPYTPLQLGERPQRSSRK